MLNYLVVALILITAIIAVSNVESLDDSPTHDTVNVNETANHTNKITFKPDCFVDLDCGVSGLEDYSCWKDFIIQDYITHRCVFGGTPNASCVNETEREYVDWCRPNEICVPGNNVCQLKRTCDDGIKNHGEEGVDCGGPCSSCSSCYDSIRNGDEIEVDCGGSCPDCVIQCTSDSSCGIPRWSKPYCGKDGSVHQDYVTYECRNDGGYDSFCKKNKVTRITDYCGPHNQCKNGVCADDGDDFDRQYAYEDGGWYGDRRKRLSEQYTCREGESCLSEGRVYTTCRGLWCFEIKQLYD